MDKLNLLHFEGFSTKNKDTHKLDTTIKEITKTIDSKEDDTNHSIEVIDKETYQYNINIIDKYKINYPEYNEVYNNKNINTLIKIFTPLLI